VTTDERGNAEGVVTPAAAPSAAIEEGEEEQSNVESPEKEEPAVEAPKATEETPPGTPVEPYTLVIPSDIPPGEQTPERLELMAGFAAVAAKSGIGPVLGQQMFDAAVDLAFAISYRPHDSEYGDISDAEHEMVAAFGEETARDLVSRAQRYSKSVGKAFQDWLDASGAGNDVATVTALALAETGIFNLSPAQAQAAIETIMSDPKSGYNSDDAKKRRFQVARVHILSRIAYRDTEGHTAQLNRAARTPKPPGQTGAASPAAAQSEAAKMLGDKNHPLNVANAPGHAEAVARFHELLATQ